MASALPHNRARGKHAAIGIAMIPAKSFWWWYLPYSNNLRIYGAGTKIIFTNRNAYVLVCVVTAKLTADTIRYNRYILPISAYLIENFM
jgi:hypothetical protein